MAKSSPNKPTNGAKWYQKNVEKIKEIRSTEEYKAKQKQYNKNYYEKNKLKLAEKEKEDNEAKKTEEQKQIERRQYKADWLRKKRAEEAAEKLAQYKKEFGYE